MKEEAYHALHDLETTHWWYRGARAAYRSLLKLGLGDPDGGCRMLDVGSGSGGNLALIGGYGPTVGLEPSMTALRLTPQPPDLGLLRGGAEALPFASGTFDGVHLLGVIEHMERDDLALREAARVCRSGGVVILLTSAYPILWSHHDEANLHQRRYTPRQLRRLLKQSGLRPIRLSCQNFFTFFPTLLIRWWQRRRPQPARYDMSNPPALINEFLAMMLSFEAWLIRYVALPVGVDLIAVCRPEK